MPYLLDTNALSEPPKPKPDAGFMEWFIAADAADFYTSCLTFGELQKGIELIGSSRKSANLSMWLTRTIDDFEGRVLTIDQSISMLWAKLMADGIKSGKTPPPIDALLAAQAIHYDLTLVTRNVKDFEQFSGLDILCPWDSGTAPTML